MPIRISLRVYFFVMIRILIYYILNLIGLIIIEKAPSMFCFFLFQSFRLPAAICPYPKPLLKYMAFFDKMKR